MNCNMDQLPLDFWGKINKYPFCFFFLNSSPPKHFIHAFWQRKIKQKLKEEGKRERSTQLAVVLVQSPTH